MACLTSRGIAVVIDDMHMFLLRAHLDGDQDAVRRAHESLTGPHAMDALGALVHQAFVIAARRTFAPAYNRGQLIQYAASLRAALSERPELLDPVAAELELRRALGEDVPASPDTGARATAQLILLTALARDLELGDDATWDLLLRARQNALHQSQSI